jgi:hypothetical protein
VFTMHLNALINWHLRNIKVSGLKGSELVTHCTIMLVIRLKSITIIKALGGYCPNSGIGAEPTSISVSSPGYVLGDFESLPVL